MKKLILFGFLILLFSSCANDDSNNNSNDPVVSISHYVETSTSVSSTEGEFKTIKTGNLQNGKLFSETIQEFHNGVSQGTPITSQTYFYNGDLLTSVIDNSGNRTRYFYYDNQNKLIGAKMTIGNPNTSSSDNYYRFVHVSNSILYFEKISLPYDNPLAESFSRIIVEFDSNNNIIKAGRDSNLDGIAENQNQFSYENENLMAVTKYDGTVYTYGYSNVIDNFNVLSEKSYGKKNLRIILAEDFANIQSELKFPSKNLLSQELITNAYEILENSYYKKKTIIVTNEEQNWQNTRVTEFFFN
jgi:YD repeat-containing protein